MTELDFLALDDAAFVRYARRRCRADRNRVPRRLLARLAALAGETERACFYATGDGKELVWTAGDTTQQWIAAAAARVQVGAQAPGGLRELSELRLSWLRVQEVGLPAGVELLGVRVALERPLLLYCAEPDRPERLHSLFLLRHGAAVPDGASYLGTIEAPEGLVHVFHLPGAKL